MGGVRMLRRLSVLLVVVLAALVCSACEGMPTSVSAPAPTATPWPPKMVSSGQGGSMHIEPGLVVAGTFALSGEEVRAQVVAFPNGGTILCSAATVYDAPLKDVVKYMKELGWDSSLRGRTW